VPALERGRQLGRRRRAPLLGSNSSHCPIPGNRPQNPWIYEEGERSHNKPICRAFPFAERIPPMIPVGEVLGSNPGAPIFPANRPLFSRWIVVAPPTAKARCNARVESRAAREALQIATDPAEDQASPSGSVRGPGHRTLPLPESPASRQICRAAPGNSSRPCAQSVPRCVDESELREATDRRGADTWR